MTEPSSNGSPPSIVFKGIGAYAPEKVLTNDELSRMVDTSDEWIRTRTGIRERRIAGEQESTSSMAEAASRQAIERAGIDPQEIDLIVVATCTPDMVFPSTASLLQQRLGLREVAAFDLEAACAGFLYATEMARGYLMSGMARNALVVGSEKFSVLTDWSDRNTCVLFGDGAGAVVMGREDTQGWGVLGSQLGSDGSAQEILKVPAGGSDRPIDEAILANGGRFVHMSGKEVFKHAVRRMGTCAEELLTKTGIRSEELSYVVSHQANIRIIEAIASRLGIPMEKFPINLDRFGNTSAASIPLVLNEMFEEHRLKSGDLILMVTFGAGLSWGATIVRWQ